ncbi:MAG: NAD-dependent epimerase/dehydratase family protein [bacterium]|nr:NAD-dependent epimerase/dehydratase family protein [bacterium]
MKKILITGGTGFIGSYIAKTLLKEKSAVRILDNEFRNKNTELEKNAQVEYIKGDIRDASVVLRASHGIDSIIHLAYINGTKYFYEKPDLVLSVGVKGMINILDAAREKNVSELFLASSSEVYQTPPSVPTPEDVPYFIPSLTNPRYSYAGGKIISELLTYHLGATFLKKAVIFRPHNVYGPAMGTEHVIPELLIKLQHIQGNTLSIQGTGNETRSFIYIDDFVEGILLLLKKGKHREVYNIGTDEEISMKNLAMLLAKISGKEITISHTLLKPGSVKRRCPDITKLRKLGFSPKISLAEGLKKTFLWYNNRHHL